MKTVEDRQFRNNVRLLDKIAILFAAKVQMKLITEALGLIARMVKWKEYLN
jgi:hypothetical protein